MTSFAHVEHMTEHPGVARMERTVNAAKELAHGFGSARGGATLLLAAIVSALVVIANQVIDTWTEGHLFAAWVVMWAVAFAALALLAGPVRRAALALRGLAKRVAATHRQSVQEERLWQLALSDARVMAEISRATGVDYRYRQIP